MQTISDPFLAGCPTDEQRRREVARAAPHPARAVVSTPEPEPVSEPDPVLPEGWRTFRKSRLDRIASDLDVPTDGTRDQLITRLETLEP